MSAFEAFEAGRIVAEVPWRGLATTEGLSVEPTVLLVLDGVAMMPLALEDASLRWEALEDATVEDEVDRSTLNGEVEPPHDVFPCVGGEPGFIDELPL